MQSKKKKKSKRDEYGRVDMSDFIVEDPDSDDERAHHARRLMLPSDGNFAAAAMAHEQAPFTPGSTARKHGNVCVGGCMRAHGTVLACGM